MIRRRSGIGSIKYYNLTLVAVILALLSGVKISPQTEFWSANPDLANYVYAYGVSSTSLHNALYGLLAFTMIIFLKNITGSIHHTVFWGGVVACFFGFGFVMGSEPYNLGVARTELNKSEVSLPLRHLELHQTLGKYDQKCMSLELGLPDKISLANIHKCSARQPDEGAAAGTGI